MRRRQSKDIRKLRFPLELSLISVVALLFVTGVQIHAFALYIESTETSFTKLVASLFIAWIHFTQTYNYFNRWIRSEYTQVTLVVTQNELNRLNRPSHSQVHLSVWYYFEKISIKVFCVNTVTSNNFFRLTIMLKTNRRSSSCFLFPVKNGEFGVSIWSHFWIWLRIFLQIFI